MLHAWRRLLTQPTGRFQPVKLGHIANRVASTPRFYAIDLDSFISKNLETSAEGLDEADKAEIAELEEMEDDFSDEFGEPTRLTQMLGDTYDVVTTSLTNPAAKVEMGKLNKYYRKLRKLVQLRKEEKESEELKARGEQPKPHVVYELEENPEDEFFPYNVTRDRHYREAFGRPQYVRRRAKRNAIRKNLIRRARAAGETDEAKLKEMAYQLVPEPTKTEDYKALEREMNATAFKSQLEMSQYDGMVMDFADYEKYYVEFFGQKINWDELTLEVVKPSEDSLIPPEDLRRVENDFLKEVYKELHPNTLKNWEWGFLRNEQLRRKKLETDSLNEIREEVKKLEGYVYPELLEEPPQIQPADLIEESITIEDNEFYQYVQAHTIDELLLNDDDEAYTEESMIEALHFMPLDAIIEMTREIAIKVGWSVQGWDIIDIMTLHSPKYASLTQTWLEHAHELEPHRARLESVRRTLEGQFRNMPNKDRIWGLHREDYKYWTHDRLAKTFGISKQDAKAACILGELEESIVTGRPMIPNKNIILFENERRVENAKFKVSQRVRKDKDLYRDYLHDNALPTPLDEDGELVEKLRPFATVGEETDIKQTFEVLPEMENKSGLGNTLPRAKFMFKEIGKFVTEDSRKYIVRDVDGRLRTATQKERTNMILTKHKNSKKLTKKERSKIMPKDMKRFVVAHAE